MHSKNLLWEGKLLSEADKVLILIHGRGSNARDILGLAPHLNLKEYALLAPQATNNSWYPFSFMAKPEQNEPWLSSALAILKDLLKEVTDGGIPSRNIYFLGFSQGACLTLEFVARHAKRYGGVVAFTGGLIGDQLYPENYTGKFNETPILLSTGHPDPHVPLARVKESVSLMEKMGAYVHLEVYNNKPHTISQEEIDLANHVIFQAA